MAAVAVSLRSLEEFPRGRRVDSRPVDFRLPVEVPPAFQLPKSSLRLAGWTPASLWRSPVGPAL